MKPRLFLVLSSLLVTAGVAAADPTMVVTPTKAGPGDAVLVTVKGSKDVPKGDAAGVKLEFFKSKTGYQAVFAVPLEVKEDHLSVEVDSVKKAARVALKKVTFKETNVIVEEEMANPPAADKPIIDEDNKAMITAMVKNNTGEPQFTTAFKRPVGGTTSPFGEWRTFNDGHRSQHLGIDLFAKEGAKVKAVNAGTVALVRDTFLAGKVVVIAHGRGIASAYFHLSAATVAEGDTVHAGDEIGAAGATGRTTGPHLHLAVRVPGGFVDPASFFKLAIAPAPTATAKK